MCPSHLMDSGERFDRDIEKQAEQDLKRLQEKIVDTDIYRLCSSLDKIAIAIHDLADAIRERRG